MDAIKETLRLCAAALRDAGVPFALGGSVAAWARGGPETCNDLDFIVAPADAEAALAALQRAGLRPERPPEGWLLKAWDGDVLVDLIFELTGVDVPEGIARAEELQVLAVTMPVLCIEDVLTAKLLAFNDHFLDFTGVLQMARSLREQIDWEQLRRATGASPYARAFLVLVEELGLVDGSAAPEPAR